MVPEWKEPPMSKEDQIEKLFEEKKDSLDFSFQFKGEEINPDNPEEVKREAERNVLAKESFPDTQEGRFGLIATYDPLSINIDICALFTFCLVDLKERTVRKVFSYPYKSPDVPSLAKMHLQFDKNKNPEFAGFIFLDAVSRDWFPPKKVEELDRCQDLYVVKL